MNAKPGCRQSKLVNMSRIAIRVTRLSLLLAATSLIMSGCWGRMEMENLSFMTLLGLDTVEDLSGGGPPAREAGLQVTVGVTIPRPTVAGGSTNRAGRPPIALFTVTARNISAALQAAEMSVGRDLTAIHLEALVIGEDLAKQGLDDVLDFVLRFRDLRHSIPVIIVEGSAREFIDKISPSTEERPSIFLRKLIATAIENRITRQIHVHDLMVSRASKSKDALIPLVRLWRESAKGADGGASSETWSATVVGSAVFKDTTMVGKLDALESIHALMLRGRTRKSSQVYPITPQGTPALDAPDVAGIEWEESKIRAKVRLQPISIDVEVDLEGNVTELPSQLDISKPEGLKRLEQEIGEGARFHFQRVIAKAQNEFRGADIFFFGDIARRRFATWDEWISFDWPERFRQASVDVSVKVRLRRPGLTLRNIWRLD